MKKNFKIIFAGGGTGGHLFSGIAVAQVMREKFPESEALFVGTPFGLEKELVPQFGFPVKFIAAGPLKGSGFLLRIRSLLRLPMAYVQSKKILREYQPDMVIGIGGYASGPMTLAAHFSKIFTGIIEQNAYPGFTNRRLGRFVDRVFVAFEMARKFFDPKKTFLTGNPVRRFPSTPGNSPGERFGIFILGGSQGAHALNVAVIQALPELTDLKDRLQFFHQTGKNDFETVKDAYQSGSFSAEVFPFMEDPGPCYAGSQLALCRAGAGTIAELKQVGLPAILVPYPYAADNHQDYNAKEMVEEGAGEMIQNQDLTGERIAERIKYYFAHPDVLTRMREKTRSLGKPDAALEVLNHCLLAME